jgi:hypothetical protein
MCSLLTKRNGIKAIYLYGQTVCCVLRVCLTVGSLRSIFLKITAARPTLKIPIGAFNMVYVRKVEMAGKANTGGGGFSVVHNTLGNK